MALAIEFNAGRILGLDLRLTIFKDCEEQHRKVATMEAEAYNAELLEDEFDDVQQVAGKDGTGDCDTKEQLFAKREMSPN
mmetsp:Transcript_33241/g.62083  ORF Transcript_33241/g.62083 Transcript_33241/m.62083 type:complete len:80 (-) Transcript_33241:161-400(-)